MLTQPGTSVAPDAAVINDADPLAAFSDRSLLIVDDDKPFSTRLARAMEARGYHVQVAESVAEGVSVVESRAPAFAVIDMRLGDGNGLDVIARLKERRPEARGVILTGYGNIATAVLLLQSLEQERFLRYKRVLIEATEERWLWTTVGLLDCFLGALGATALFLMPIL